VSRPPGSRGGAAIDRTASTTVRLRWPGDPGAPGGRANRVGFAYDAYVPGEIAGWDPALPGSLVADLARAEDAVRALDRHGPLLAALAWPLLRAEAIASSRIEGLAVSHHRLALAEHGGSGDAVARDVVGNLSALRRALGLAGAGLTPGGLDGIHRALLGRSRDAALAGRVRTVQNWIGGRHDNPRGAAFVPPPPEEVPRLLEDLTAFCRRDDVPVLVQAAIAHVQFETVHPYFDGNGRVGRALVHVVLRRRGLSREVLPPVSLVLGRASEEYVAGMTAHRRGDTVTWLSFFAGAVHAAARAGEALAGDVAGLQARWAAQAGHPRRDSAAAALIAALPAAPVVDLAGARRLTGASAKSTLAAIDRLVAAGVLHERTGRRRGRVWESVGLFGLLDGLEAHLGTPRAGRRDRTDAPWRPGVRAPSPAPPGPAAT
jgi:Fic family protein